MATNQKSSNLQAVYLHLSRIAPCFGQAHSDREMRRTMNASGSASSPRCKYWIDNDAVDVLLAFNLRSGLVGDVANTTDAQRSLQMLHREDGPALNEKARSRR